MDEGLRFEHHCEICFQTNEVTGLTMVQWEFISRLTREAHQHSLDEKAAHLLASARAHRIADREDRDDEAAAL
jgi:hypothetical protein